MMGVHHYMEVRVCMKLRQGDGHEHEPQDVRKIAFAFWLHRTDRYLVVDLKYEPVRYASQTSAG